MEKALHRKLFPFQVQHLQKVLIKKRDPVTHVCFIDELAIAKVDFSLFTSTEVVSIYTRKFLWITTLVIFVSGW